MLLTYQLKTKSAVVDLRCQIQRKPISIFNVSSICKQHFTQGYNGIVKQFKLPFLSNILRDFMWFVLKDFVVLKILCEVFGCKGAPSELIQMRTMSQWITGNFLIINCDSSMTLHTSVVKDNKTKRQTYTIFKGHNW